MKYKMKKGLQIVKLPILENQIRLRVAESVFEAQGVGGSWVLDVLPEKDF